MRSGRAGRAELTAAGDETVAAIRTDNGLDGVGWTGFLADLDKVGC